MVILDPDIVRASVHPAEGDPPLVVYPDTICPFAVALQLFEAIPWRHAQFERVRHAVEDAELAARGLLDVRRQLAAALSRENQLCLGIVEASDHALFLSGHDLL
jgi:hypothetical protein